MMALAVLGIGGAGIVAMQRTTVLGNERGRNLATANAIAASWAERLRADGARWYVDASGSAVISGTRWLQKAGSNFPGLDSGVGEGAWFRPGDLAAEDIHPAADVFGRDLDASATEYPDEVAYCTHVRLTQVLPRVIRAEIRVFWLRKNGGGVLTSGSGDLCSSSSTYVGEVATAPERYHFVYLTTSILRQGS
jgi:type IV pilus assembly protein PilV